MNKVYPDAKSALEGILKDGMMVMSGGLACAASPKRCRMRCVSPASRI